MGRTSTKKDRGRPTGRTSVGQIGDAKDRHHRWKEDSARLLCLDDFTRAALIDPVVGFSCSKSYLDYKALPFHTQIEMKKLLKFHVFNRNEETENVICFILKHFYHEPALNIIVHNYLALFDYKSGVTIGICTAFKSEIELKLVATKFWQYLDRLQLFNKTSVFRSISVDVNPYSIACVTPGRKSLTSFFMGSLSLINHHCDPNATFASSEKEGTVIEIKKPIQVGEEICASYGPRFFRKGEFTCLCSKCRNVANAGSRSAKRDLRLKIMRGTKKEERSKARKIYLDLFKDVEYPEGLEAKGKLSERCSEKLKILRPENMFNTFNDIKATITKLRQTPVEFGCTTPLVNERTSSIDEETISLMAILADLVCIGVSKTKIKQEEITINLEAINSKMKKIKEYYSLNNGNSVNSSWNTNSNTIGRNHVLDTVNNIQASIDKLTNDIKQSDCFLQELDDHMAVLIKKLVHAFTRIIKYFNSSIGKLESKPDLDQSGYEKLIEEVELALKIYSSENEKQSTERRTMAERLREKEEARQQKLFAKRGFQMNDNEIIGFMRNEQNEPAHLSKSYDKRRNLSPYHDKIDWAELEKLPKKFHKTILNALLPPDLQKKPAANQQKRIRKRKTPSDPDSLKRSKKLHKTKGKNDQIISI